MCRAHSCHQECWQAIRPLTILSNFIAIFFHHLSLLSLPTTFNDSNAPDAITPPSFPASFSLIQSDHLRLLRTFIFFQRRSKSHSLIQYFPGQKPKLLELCQLFPPFLHLSSLVYPLLSVRLSPPVADTFTARLIKIIINPSSGVINPPPIDLFHSPSWPSGPITCVEAPREIILE